MRHVIVSAVLLVLAGASAATAQELKSDEQKTLYALGLIVGQNLAGVNLSAADLETVKAGIRAGGAKKGRGVARRPFGPKIRGLQNSRAAAIAAVEKKAGQAF